MTGGLAGSAPLGKDEARHEPLHETETADGAADAASDAGESCGTAVSERDSDSGDDSSESDELSAADHDLDLRMDERTPIAHHYENEPSSAPLLTQEQSTHLLSALLIYTRACLQLASNTFLTPQ